MSEPVVVLGAVEPRVAGEFPGLELRWCTAPAPAGPSPPALRRRLRALSDRYAGARVVAMRTQPVAHAYRAFFRHVGLDPDQTRIPSEAAAVRRLIDGGFRSRDRVTDALLVALVETGVPVWALDAAHVEAETLGIRSSRAGERLGEAEVGAGRLVVADAERAHGLLFGALAPGRAPGARTQSAVLFALTVDGVPALFAEEALWLAAEQLA